MEPGFGEDDEDHEDESTSNRLEDVRMSNYAFS